MNVMDGIDALLIKYALTHKEATCACAMMDIQDQGTGAPVKANDQVLVINP